MPVRVLIEGRPGSGKTTVAARLAALLVESGVPVRGFVTHELREHGRRVGFDVESLEGERATLAHVSFRGPPRVGKYGVDLEAFERVALPALATRRRRGVVVIDELGKMELEPNASAKRSRSSWRSRRTSPLPSTSSDIRSPTSSSGGPVSRSSASHASAETRCRTSSPPGSRPVARAELVRASELLERGVVADGSEV